MDPVDQRGFDNQPAEELTAPDAARCSGSSSRRSTRTRAAGSSGACRDRRAGAAVPAPTSSGSRRAATRARATGRSRRARCAGESPSSRRRYRQSATADRRTAATRPSIWRRAACPSRRSPSCSGRARSTSARARGRSSACLPRCASCQTPSRADVSPLRAMLAAVPRLALADGDRFGASREAEWARARRLVRVLAAAVGGIHDEATSGSAAREATVAASLAVALGLPRAGDARRNRPDARARRRPRAQWVDVRGARGRIDRRGFYACITGALAALTGPLHGGASDGSRHSSTRRGLPSELARCCRRARAAATRSRGSGIPSTAGDPRTAPLMAVAREVGARARKDDRNRLAVVFAIEAAVERAGRGRPNLDFGLVAVARALGLRRGSASILFASGASPAGWPTPSSSARRVTSCVRAPSTSGPEQAARHVPQNVSGTRSSSVGGSAKRARSGGRRGRRTGA